MGLKLEDPSFPLENNSSEYHKKKTISTVNFILEALFKYKDLMLTDSGKTEANKRHQCMVSFLDNFFKKENALEWIDILNKYPIEK